MITGMTTVPIVTAAPMTSIPASIHSNPGTVRMSVPHRTPVSEISSAISAPARRMTSAATGVRRANISTGAVVISPAAAEPIPRSLSISRSTGVGATIGPRRLIAATRMPTTTRAIPVPGTNDRLPAVTRRV